MLPVAQVSSTPAAERAIGAVALWPYGLHSADHQFLVILIICRAPGW